MYDINNERIPESSELTVDIARERINKYYELLNNETDEHKRGVYTTYIKNLNSWLLGQYLNNPELFKTVIGETKEDEITKAINELKAQVTDDGTVVENTEDTIHDPVSTNIKVDSDEEPGNDAPIERNDGDVHEERAISQSDLLVSREGETIMDEYVEYEEQ